MQKKEAKRWRMRHYEVTQQVLAVLLSLHVTQELLPFQGSPSPPLPARRLGGLRKGVCVLVCFCVNVSVSVSERERERERERTVCVSLCVQFQSCGNSFKLSNCLGQMYRPSPFPTL